MRDIQQQITTIYREESRRVLATLIRLLGDFDLAEEGLHDAFAAAIQQWPSDGLPDNPRAWLVSAGRFKAIDRIRKRARFDDTVRDLAVQFENEADEIDELDEQAVHDDHLRLIFTCCHPALAADAQVALTLREVCSLTTEEIARAFLTATPTIAQRIVRAKAKIKSAGIPYELPDASQLPERLESVLRVVYLVFNEGYSPSAGDSVTRADLSAEAIRLGQQLFELLPDPEVAGLLALMLLHDSRRDARSGADGDIVLLADQDRASWDQERIAQGIALVERAISSRRFGVYTLQAAISAVHAEAKTAADTDWTQIIGLYDLLMRMMPSPVVALNRAAAIAMRDGPEAGLTLIDTLLLDGELTNYHLAHSARGELCRRLGRIEDAKRAYEQALALTPAVPEQRLLQKRIAELGV